MKTQAFLTFLLVVMAALLVASNSDDEKCRDFAINSGINQDELANVDRFRMYGMPRAPDTCQSVCDKHSLNLGFEYIGKQACCCTKLLH